MWSKLFKGELGLGVTFWKYGVFALILQKVAVKFFDTMLAGYLNGNTILTYFTRYFHPIYSSKFSILWTLCYVSGLIVMLVYSLRIVLAVWRSSLSYDKSLWLRFLARLFIILLVFWIWYTIDLRPLF